MYMKAIFTEMNTTKQLKPVRDLHQWIIYCLGTVDATVDAKRRYSFGVYM